MSGSDFTFIDLFAGIGGMRLAFEAIGGRCVFSSEIDTHCRKMYLENFGELPAGDIRSIDEKNIPDHDILVAGFPCQAFSIIGRREGFGNETCGTLFFDIERILRNKLPPAFLLENVRNLIVHDNGRTFQVIRNHLTKLGYKVHAKVLNALDYGLPQKRERIIIIGFLDNVEFDFPAPMLGRKTLSDILENDVDKKYYVRECIRASRMKRLKIKVINENANPKQIGYEVIAIWNTRVEEIRSRFPHMRTVVLIKSEDLLTLRIFEIDTKRYDAETYIWSWNKRGNLEGYKDGIHCFTWQPHGSQFTIIEDIPDNVINFKLKSPPRLDKSEVLRNVGFDKSWITLI